MQTVKKIVLAIALAFALFGSAAGAAATFGAHPATTQTHVLADVTPAVTCGGGGSGNCK